MGRPKSIPGKEQGIAFSTRSTLRCTNSGQIWTRLMGKSLPLILKLKLSNQNQKIAQSTDKVKEETSNMSPPTLQKTLKISSRSQISTSRQLTSMASLINQSVSSNNKICLKRKVNLLPISKFLQHNSRRKIHNTKNRLLSKKHQKKIKVRKPKRLRNKLISRRKNSFM